MTDELEALPVSSIIDLVFDFVGMGGIDVLPMRWMRVVMGVATLLVTGLGIIALLMDEEPVWVLWFVVLSVLALLTLVLVTLAVARYVLGAVRRRR